MTFPEERPVSNPVTPVTDASPKAFWRFEDDLTDTASVGPYNLALTIGTETYDTIDNARVAFDLDGSTYLTATGYKGILGSNPRAVSAWIKTTDDTTVIISWGNNATGQRWQFRIHNNGVLLVDCSGGNVIGSTPVNDGKLHHVVFVLDSGDTDVNLVKLYIDNVKETLASSSSETINTVGTKDVVIGYFEPLADLSRVMIGQIDEVAIFDGLTEQEITDIYNGGRPVGEYVSGWKESTDEWVTTDLPRGGGRYKVQLITLSDQGKIYYGAL